jgi:hypothetical protein
MKNQEQQFNNTRKQTKQFLKELSPDEKHQIYKKGWDARELHSEPSPETRERLAKLETNQLNYMEQNTKEHQELKELIIGIKQDLKETLEKKANIWVEKVLIWIGIAIGTGIVGFVTWFISTGMQFRK